MLAYAASRPAPVDQRPHPHTMLLIIGAHVALVAAVMSAKMELPIKPPPIITHIDFIPAPPVPPQHPIKTPEPTQTSNSWIDDPQPHVPIKIDLPPFDRGPVLDPGTIGGAGTTITTEISRPPVTIAKSGPQLLTPPSELKPPYPASKLLNEEEAVLTLRLTIDENGRVIAVDPVGRADRAFLDAARRHLLAHWRYKPATEDGRAIMSSAIVTLHFELDG